MSLSQTSEKFAVLYVTIYCFFAHFNDQQMHVLFMSICIFNGQGKPASHNGEFLKLTILGGPKEFFENLKMIFTGSSETNLKFVSVMPCEGFAFFIIKYFWIS